MYSPIGDFWRRLLMLWGLILIMSVSAEVGAITPQSQAVAWQDTLYVRITDSVFLENEKALVFSLEIYRPNDNWNKDKVLGDFDFYFSYSNKAFAGTTTPTFERLLPEIDQTALRKNLLSGYTRFYAGRYGICGRADNSGGATYVPPLRTWVELCRVKIPMDHIDQNPGIRWDVRATGAMTAGGNPIILKLMGDVEQNPKATVKAAGLHVMPELQCQGEDVYVYVRDAVTSGKGLDFVWRDSVAGETWNPLGTFNATSAVKTGSSKNGRYRFEILGDGDTLVIKNSPGIVDGMFFRCTLTDASVGASMTVDTAVQLRDSLFGYFASTMPSVKYGMTTGIDTVDKCPDLPANLDVYIFGPTQSELKKEFGSTITLYYCYQDEDLNTQRDSVKIDCGQLAMNINYIKPDNADNKLKRDLFKHSLKTIKHVGKLWVESIRTEFCNNGVGYPLYDTLMVQEVEGDLSYNLDQLTLGVYECVDLDTAWTITPKPYQVFLKRDPSLIGGGLAEANGVYTYCAGNTAGLDTVYYQYKKASCTMKAYRGIEVVENSYLTMKVLLEGPYLGLDAKGRDTMRCVYVAQELLGYQTFPRNNVGRFKSPYKDDLLLGVDVKSISDVKTDKTICDWVYIQLKEETIIDGVSYPNQVIDSTSAFVLCDGSICDIRGEVLKFKNIKGKKVYIELKHRNHLKIRSQKSFMLPTNRPNNIVVDLSDPTVVYYGMDMLKLISGKYCMYAGDLNEDGYITVPDKTVIMNNIGKTQYDYDVNGDNYITVPDKNVVHYNLGVYAK